MKELELTESLSVCMCLFAFIFVSILWYKMEISAQKTKLMTNSANNIQRDKGKTADAGYCNKLGAVVSDDGCKPEILSRIAQATASLAKLKPIWKDNTISW